MAGRHLPRVICSLHSRAQIRLLLHLPDRAACGLEAGARADSAAVCQPQQLAPPPRQIRHQGGDPAVDLALAKAAACCFCNPDGCALKCLLLKHPVLAAQHLWVTPFAEGELYPAGYYPLEPNPVGIEQWTENNRSLVGKDLVLWHTMGVTHIPRPEDFPVMCELTWRPVWS